MNTQVKQEPLIIGDFEVSDPSAAIPGQFNITSDDPMTHSVVTSGSFHVMKSLLYGWGLEVLSERFATNLIEVCLLEHMREDDIKELCAGLPMRYRIILRHKIEDKCWNRMGHDHLINDESHSKQETSRKNVCSMSDKSIQVNLGPVSKEPESLIEICKRSEPGRKFLEKYQVEDGKKTFNAECRDLIKKAIVDHFFVLGKGTVQARDFVEMIKIITAELPDEDPRIWYSTVQNNKIKQKSQTPNSGLLYSRYRYLKQRDTRFKKPIDAPLDPPAVVANERTKQTWETMPQYERDACIAAKLTLGQFGIVNKEDVIKYWRDSYPLRRYESVTRILKYNEWEVLTKHDKIHDLITLDFCMTLSPIYDKVRTRLPLFVNRYKNVYQEYKGSIEDDKELKSAIWSSFVESKTVTDRATFLALYTLPLILRANFIMLGRKRLKPSLVDSRNSFITVLKRETEMDGIIQDRRECDLENETRMNPFIIAIGSVSQGIQRYHVVLDQDVVFPCDTITTALDLLFKLFIAFSIDYPQRCETVWKFIQHFLYEITHGDRLDSNIAALVTDLNRGASAF